MASSRATRDGLSARDRLLEAAIECIAEEGYYRASSNQIARRAGLTWGVIQHHFGTRERLLLEVVRDGAQDLLATFEKAQIEGDTPLERLESLADVVWSHYCTPEFLVRVQIVMNLSRDPTTARETVEALSELAERTLSGWQRLVDQVVAPKRQPPGISAALFQILRGVAVGEELLESMVATTEPRRPRTAERKLLLRALATQLEAT
jgi:AcrR family transcriptional regulator